MFEPFKIDFHNFSAKNALEIAIWLVANKFMYEQATDETISMIDSALDSCGNEFISKGIIWEAKSDCYIRYSKLVLEIIFAETPKDALKPTKVQLELSCG